MDIEEPCKFPQLENGRRNHSNNFMNREIANSPNSEEEDENKRVALVRPAGEEPEPPGGDGANRPHRWPHSSRIIRVSRATGGKDRHSKVWTSKGLRDRRVRLSVATAIQFYDLQDRLGFDQPSKAVEWLIEAASDAIAELPSLTGFFDKDPPNNPSFTALLTGAAADSRLHHLGQIEHDRAQHFSIAPENLGDSNLSFTVSSGCNRGTLQSNVPFFVGAASPAVTAPVQMENHHHHHHQLTPALFDGSWQLHHSDQKGKGKN